MYDETNRIVGKLFFEYNFGSMVERCGLIGPGGGFAPGQGWAAARRR